MPSVVHSDLNPYVTLLLLRATSSTKQKESVRALLDEIAKLIKAIDDGVTRKLVSTGVPETDEGTTIGFVSFTERRPPTWLAVNPAVKLNDVVHQLIVVAQHKNLVAVCTSDGDYQSELVRAIASADGTYPALEQLVHISAQLLNAAFVHGHTRTLWLSGIHRPTAVKPDAKILSGSNLVSALNPLGDQSYTFSAVRCSPSSAELKRPTIGVTPRKSRVWSGPSASYDDFREQVGGILKHLHIFDLSGSLNESPIPYLAVAVTDASTIRDAYDLAVIAPELLSDDTALKPEDRALAEKYAFRARFDVTGTKGPDLRVEAKIDGEVVGTFDLALKFGADGRVTHEVVPLGTSLSTPVEKELARVLGRRDWLSIHYESGHTVSQGSCFRQQFRDQRFEGWEWRPFVGYAVHEEKPMKGKSVAFDQIGKSNSLFCYTHKHWSAPATGVTDGRKVWLACDDGANEIADFVRFEYGGSTRPQLTLIHVKGSHSELPARQLSVSAFEIVVSQAVKNIRALSTPYLLQLLEKGGKNATKQFAWMDGTSQSDRSGMIAAIEAADRQFEVHVMIVQPSARRSEYSRALPASKSNKGTALPGWYHRRAQLDTLLISAQAACFEVGARLTVVGDDT